ncbi:putative membrane protein [Nocardioides aromaticivorans]|uniref:Putative membrane protein n=1 Tax=Nocardioides aromaticivorans TaxID=200618 RepID=A0A7Z0CNZ1_9ACTN|nr:DUF202 domain-containing protein [Nocardioides aromaticivorans]NYI45317.1 putative membrane protein [Nocardioides aromaticivorans]
MGAESGPARRQRWPARVYGTGAEPDYRFSLANERTFLAWLRTSMALVAGAVALDAFATGYPRPVVQAVAGALVALGGAGAVLAWARWSAGERAIRRGEPLPGFRAGAAACAVLVAVATTAAFLVLVR